MQLFDMTETTQQIIALLQRSGAEYQLMQHDHVTDSAGAASARGTAQKIGIKALLIKTPGGFQMLTMAADRQLHSARVRSMLKSQKLRFASAEELMAIAGVTKGALPPIGQLFGLNQYLDSSVLENQQVAFTCGSNTTSVIMQTSSFIALIDYQQADFTKP